MSVVFAPTNELMDSRGEVPPVDIVEADEPTEAAPARRKNAVASWKRQVTLFAGSMAALVMLVAGGAAAGMWHVLSTIGQTEVTLEARGRAAVNARLAVLDLDRMLLRTIAAVDADTAASAAAASISAASRLGDAVTTLLQVLPGDADATEIGRLAEVLRAPRMNVIALATKGEKAPALEALQGLAEPLAKIDALSTRVLEAQAEYRSTAALERDELFTLLVWWLVVLGGFSILVGLVFHRRLMFQFARSDQVEQLLEEVAHSAEQLDADGRQLDGVNAEVQQANEKLRMLLERFQSSCLTMTHEAKGSLNDLQELSSTCQTSADTSRQHAEEAAVVAEQIRSTSKGMHQLQSSAQKLGERRAEIADFADQIARISATTRLLSLNAAVEAARAGDAGRGFGVIATSVRQLSEDTQKAAVQIRRASEDITFQLTATTDAVRKTGELMDDCTGRVAALDTSARSNQVLASEMASDVHGFRGSLERQVHRIEAMDRESQGLVQALQEGQGHAQLLDATSRALAETSTALHQRLSSLQD